MLSLEREHHERRASVRARKGGWTGYARPELERLRRGVGPEDIAALQALKPTAEAAEELGEMSRVEIRELER